MQSFISLIFTMTYSNIRARYRNTIAGFIWVIINPLLMYAAQSLVFQFILKIQVRNYSLFLLGGLLPWIFITSSMDMCIPILESSRDLLKALKVHPFVIVCSQLIDNFFNFIVAFLIILIPFLLMTGGYNLKMLFVPVSLVLLLIGVGSAVWILSLWHVFFRDVRFISQFIMNIFFFLTPIFYPRSMVPEKYQFLVDYNPFYILIAPFRLSITSGSLNLLMSAFLRSFTLSSILFVLAVIVWKRKRNRFYISL